MRVVRGVTQHYAWGDTDAIPHLLGVPPDGRPWAEVWFGTHHGGPATLDGGELLETLTGPLPFMVKLLAADQPLSLQTHPDEATARGGYADETARGVPLDDPRRTFRDPHAKPELICALTPFTALCGFRPLDDTLRLLDDIGATDLAASVRDHGLAGTVAALYRHQLSTDATIAVCRAHDSDEARLVADLDRRYPGEPSVAVALLLHLVHLEPGEALFLGPGNLHAYVRGLGVEVMGASDNVVRGGLTLKHVDVDALLSIVRLEPTERPVVHPIADPSGGWRYPTPGAPFRVTRIDLDGTVHLQGRGVELLVCTAGDASPLQAGRAVVVTEGEAVTLSGTATVYRIGAA